MSKTNRYERWAIAALALFAAFRETAGITTIDITRPTVMAGLFLGAMMPFLFSSMAMKAVGRAAQDMINEVRRQFKEIPGLMEGEAQAEYAKCVDISTAAALVMTAVYLIPHSMRGSELSYEALDAGVDASEAVGTADE